MKKVTEETDNKGYEGKQKKKKSKRIIVASCLIGVALVGIVAVAVLILPKESNSNSGIVTTITKSTLEQVIEINDLSTLDYTYNAITNVKDESGNEIKYYVAYEGVVTAGININEVDVSVDEEGKIITITMPDAEIQSINVDMGTMEFIFEKDKYETETVSQEAYKACIDDLERRAKEEDTLLSMAKENAVDAMTALITPWIEQIDEEYMVEVK